MSTIRCHFDGKVFIPDELVKLAAGQTAEVHIEDASVEFSGGSGGTLGDLLKSDAIGAWSGLYEPEIDSLTVADELRRESSAPSHHKQRAFIDLHEAWDAQFRRQQSANEERDP